MWVCQSTGTTSTVTSASTSECRRTLTVWVPIDRIGSLRATRRRSTTAPVCASIASARSDAVTEPKSRPSVPALALTVTGLAWITAATVLAASRSFASRRSRRTPHGGCLGRDAVGRVHRSARGHEVVPGETSGHLDDVTSTPDAFDIGSQENSHHTSLQGPMFGNTGSERVVVIAVTA